VANHASSWGLALALRVAEAGGDELAAIDDARVGGEDQIRPVLLGR
jgi:hypothetical protein